MKTVVVIPTYNESENVIRLTEEVLRQDDGIHILFVDDNSPDGTGQLLSDLSARNDKISVIKRAGKLGLGSAYRTGFKAALEMGADFIMEMDADFSHDPGSIPQFIARAADFDLVIGSRYLNGVSVVNWPIRRLILSYYASVYTRFVTGLMIQDCTSGFKCFRRGALEALDLNLITSDGYSFQIEMNYRCAEKGLRICEVPIIFIDRHAGSSKMSRKIVWEAVFMVWKLKMGTLISKLFSRKIPHV